MTNNVRNSFSITVGILLFIVGCGQSQESDRSYDSGVNSGNAAAKADQDADRAEALELAMLKDVGIEEGFSGEAPTGLMLTEMTQAAKATKYSVFSVRFCSAYSYQSQFRNRVRDFCVNRRVKVADCQDVNELLNHPRHKLHQDNIDQLNIRLANQFGADAWTGEKWIQGSSFHTTERSPYYFENTYFHRPCEEVTEINKVGFNQIERVGTITASIRGKVVAQVTTGGEEELLVEITAKKNSSVVWTNSFNNERIITFLDGNEAKNEHEGVGHVVTFDLPLHNYVQPCDVNNNGETTTLDGLILSNANPSSVLTKFVDYNADGKYDTTDTLRWFENCN